MESGIFPKANRILHGGDYNPDQWLETPWIIDQDFELMRKANCNTFSVGIFAWTALEPRSGEYRFEWLDALLDRMAEHGFHVILATPSGAMPAWLAKKYPEIRRIGNDGRRAPYSGRHNHCWSSPIYQKHVRAIDSKLAERYAGHPAIIAWHISNEYSGECFCDLCQEKFREYLKTRYGTLEELNRAWSNAFWSHIHTDWAEITPWGGSECNSLDWKRFTTHQCCEFMRMEKEAVKAFNSELPVTTNMMGVFEGIDYWRVAEVCDFISDDCYPNWGMQPDMRLLLSNYAMFHDMHRAMKKGKPFLIMESSPGPSNWQPYYRLKRPNQHRFEELLAIGHGADGTLYFQWRKSQGNLERFHGAVVDHSGSGETRNFREVAALGALYEKCAGLCGARTPVEAAVVWDWDIAWSFRLSSGPGLFEQRKYLETVQAHYRALWTENIPMDVIESTSDYSGYKLLVCPMLRMLKPGVAERLKKFTADGGTLLLTYFAGYEDISARSLLGGWPGNGLMEVAGVWNEELGGIAPFDKIRVQFSGKEYEAVDYLERLHLRGAESLATFVGDPFYRDCPAFTVNRFGKGKAYYIAARTAPDFLEDAYRRIIQESALVRVLPSSNRGIHASLRRTESGDYLFLYNFLAQSNKATLPPGVYTDIETVERVENAVDLDTYASKILFLPRA